jgi:hypothetical protein
MINPTMKQNIDIRYTKVWRGKERQEEKMNKEHVPEITGFAVVLEIEDERVNKE